MERGDRGRRRRKRNMIRIKKKRRRRRGESKRQITKYTKAEWMAGKLRRETETG